MDKWKQTATKKEVNLRNGMRRVDSPLVRPDERDTVVPTSTKLKIPNQVYTAAVRAQLGAPAPPRNATYVRVQPAAGPGPRLWVHQGCDPSLVQRARRALRDALCDCAEACDLDPGRMSTNRVTNPIQAMMRGAPRPSRSTARVGSGCR